MINKIMFLIFTSILFVLLPIKQSYADGRLDRCLPYKEYIVSLLLNEGISADYFYLVVCESGCRNVVSDKGAHGFFQVTYPIYKFYMPDECSIDDIDDIKCNTIAAARYIKHLRERFNHIALLVKAYNRGGTNLQKHGTTKEANALSRCVLQYISNDNM